VGQCAALAGGGEGPPGLGARIIRDNQAVYVDLAVSGLVRGRLAKSVHDAGWSAFVGMVEYKATKHGRVFGRIGRFEPTTRTCSGCGWYGPKLELSVRTFGCSDCGLVADRDVNAARIGIFGVHTEEDVNV
jgi:putative transposase